MTKIETMIENLALAFGGDSQYGMRDVGRALFGHQNNAGLVGEPEDLALEAVRVISDRRGLIEPDETVMHTAVMLGYNERLKEVFARAEYERLKAIRPMY